MAVTRIQLDIGEVVLHGVAPADRHRVGDALRARLERLLARPELFTALQGPISLDRLELPALHGDTRAEALGSALADTLVAGLCNAVADRGAPSVVRPAARAAARQPAARQLAARQPAAPQLAATAAGARVAALRGSPATESP